MNGIKVHISYTNKNNKIFIISEKTLLLLNLVTNLFVKMFGLWGLACVSSDRETVNGASSSPVLCWLLGSPFGWDAMRMLCMHYPAGPLHLSGSAPPRFLLLFFILWLQSLQAQPVWARTLVQCACVLWLQFRQLFLKTEPSVYIYLFVNAPCR